MTKKVRIENADTANYKVKIEVWEKGPDGKIGFDKHIETIMLNNPADMREISIWKDRFLIIKEEH